MLGSGEKRWSSRGDFDVPVQAVAETGGNVLKDWCQRHLNYECGCSPIKESKEAKKAALLDALVAALEDGHRFEGDCPSVENDFKSRDKDCLVCCLLIEYDAIEKDGKP